MDRNCAMLTFLLVYLENSWWHWTVQANILYLMYVSFTCYDWLKERDPCKLSPHHFGVVHKFPTLIWQADSESVLPVMNAAKDWLNFLSRVLILAAYSVSSSIAKIFSVPIASLACRCCVWEIDLAANFCSFNSFAFQAEECSKVKILI